MSSQEASVPEAPSNKPLLDLFAEIEAAMAKTTSLSKESWYILTLTCLTAGPEPHLAGELYLHLCSKAEFSTSEQRQALVRRLREVLIKAVAIVGAPKPVDAIMNINRVERPEDKDYSCSRRGWTCGEDSHASGMDWLAKVYTRDTEGLVKTFEAQQDFVWLSANIIYGLLLSDRQILDDVNTEMIVVAAIMMQNLKTESRWHIRGTRRVGVSMADTEVICSCVRTMAAHFGMVLDKVPTVQEVEPDV